jgi:hypothetical protein
LVILRLLTIGIRGSRLAAPDRARVTRTARLITATMLGSAVVALTGLAISVAAVGAVLPIPETAYRRKA